MKKTKTTASKGYQESDDVFLKKHVGLIHCENKLTLMQRKICNILLFNALDKINTQEIHEISLRQLCSLIGYHSNDIKLIKEAIKGLISIVMEWNLLEDSKFLNEDNYPEDMITWNASSLLAGASIRKGLIRYSYSPQMRSVLASLDIYGRINLFVQAKFNSTYSLVLYENCIRFKNLKQTAWFTIELFRSLMGVSANKYSSFKEFKRNVINVAVHEINQKSDIMIEPQYRKAGRTIVAIQFLLNDNEKYQPAFKKLTQYKNKDVIEESVMFNILMAEFHLSEKQSKEILLSHSNEFILEKINLVKNKKNVENIGAYLLSAIKNDYKNKEKKPPKSEENSYLREAKQASEILSLKNKYMAYKSKIYTRCIEQQETDRQQQIKDEFAQSLRSNVEISRFYQKSGLSSPFVMSEFIRFIEKRFAHLIDEYLSFDDFITSDEVECL